MSGSDSALTGRRVRLYLRDPLYAGPAKPPVEAEGRGQAVLAIHARVEAVVAGALLLSVTATADERGRVVEAPTPYSLLLPMGKVDHALFD